MCSVCLFVCFFQEKPTCAIHEKLFERRHGREQWKKRVRQKIDCSQPFIFSYLYSIVERAERIARELDASAKQRLDWVGSGDSLFLLRQ